MVDRDVGVGQPFQRREQADFTLSSRVTEHWSGYARHLRDLARGQALLTEVGIAYEDECTIFRVTARRDFFENVETRRRSSGDSIVFSILFKTLGEIQTSP
jgi:lipopolysaccharide assembly outer membrane protein LptD (OstA)